MMTPPRILFRGAFRRSPGRRCSGAVAGLLAAVLASPAAAAPEYEDHPPRLLLEAPSEVAVGDTVLVGVIASSRWGPEGPEVPTAGMARVLRLEISTTDTAAEFQERWHIPESARGQATLRVVFRTAGLHRVDATGEAGLSGSSNPIRVLEQRPERPVFWGDLHGHLHTPGAGHAGKFPAAEFAQRLREGLDYARDTSRLDFAAFTPHLQTAGGLGRGRDGSGAPWDSLLRVVLEAHVAGEFLPFPGFEWQGDAGDHCVIYPGAGPLDAPADFGTLCRSVRARGALLNAHAVYLPSQFRLGNDVLTGIEVTRDSHGTEWLGNAAIDRGVAVAFLGGSDTHGGALGSTSLTGLRASELSGPAVFRAVRERRTWATNGERIVVDFDVDLSGPLPRVDLRGVGTAPIERIEVSRNGRVVAEARGFGEGPEFRFTWEDDDLLRLDCLSGPAIYYARIVQTSANRYDPSQRDVAVTSPISVPIAAAHFDSAHARRGGASHTPPGAVLVSLRDVWSRLGYAPGEAARARPRVDEPIQSFEPMQAELEGAVQRIHGLATRDPSLVELALTVASLPRVARAMTLVEETRRRMNEGDAAAVRKLARESQEQVAAAEASLRAVDRTALDRVWFAASQLIERSRLLMEEASRSLAAGEGLAFQVADSEPRREWAIPVDARVWLGLPVESARGRELRRSLHEHWGYTDPPPAEDTSVAARVRVIAEGDPEGARLVSSDGWSVPFERARNGWLAEIPASHVPTPGADPLRLEFDPPVRLQRVFVEGPRGERFTSPGRVVAFETRRLESVVRATIAVQGAPVVAELRRVGPRGDAPVWVGRLGEGMHPLAFPSHVIDEADALTLRWGFAGWRLAAATLLPGHDAARPLGFGALHDGHAIVALTDSLLFVDPVTGSVRPFPYPADHQLEPGRAFCVADLGPPGVLVRGADGPGRSWANLLDPITLGWSDLSRLVGLPDNGFGPASGTVVADPQGRLSWLTAKTFSQLDRAGRFTSMEVDVPGRLLGTGSTGQPVVGLASGGAAQLTTSGAVRHRTEGQVLAADHAGGLLVLDAIDARHAELGTGIVVSRTLPDGHRVGPFRLAVRTSPAADAPVAVAVTGEGTLLILAGTTSWRREPMHDWWGSVVERWDPVWVGNLLAR